MGVLMLWNWPDAIQKWLCGLDHPWIYVLQGVALVALLLGLFVGLVAEMTFAHRDETMRQYFENHPDDEA